MHATGANSRDLPEQLASLHDKASAVGFEWDDLRVILAVARFKSLRAGAAALGMHHSSVARRITSFEQEHGLRVFDRHQSGYLPTATGEELRQAAEEMETTALALERRVTGRDARLAGEICVTMPSALATYLLLPSVVAFAKRYPEIEIDCVGCSELANLTRRDADVAIRVSREDPPDHLVRRRAGHCSMALYESVELETDEALSTVGWTPGARFHQLYGRTDDSESRAHVRLNDVYLHLAACRAGCGRTSLPCFIGDYQPGLRRVPGVNIDFGPQIWVLTHRDLARTARIQAFVQEMWEALQSARERLQGIR